MQNFLQELLIGFVFEILSKLRKFVKVLQLLVYVEGRVQFQCRSFSWTLRLQRTVQLIEKLKSF